MLPTGLNALYNFEESGTAKSALLQQRASSDIAKYYDSDDFRTLQANTPCNMQRAGHNIAACAASARITHLHHPTVIIQRATCVLHASSMLQGQTLSQDEAPCNECWTMLEIHDWTRFLVGAPARLDLLLSALAYLLLSPGTPIVYYGLEQGFNGNCPEPSRIHNCGSATSSIEALCASGGDDSLKRQDMFASGPWRLRSAVPAVDALRSVGPTAHNVSGDWRSDPMLPRDHAAYQMARKLAALRRSCAALSSGGMVWHYASDASGGWMAFSRNAREHGPAAGAAEVVVLVNPGAGGWAKIDTVGVSGGYSPSEAGLLFANVFDVEQVGTLTFPTGGSQPYLALPSGFAVAPGSTAVFVRRDALRPWDSDLGIALCAQ